MPRPETAPSHGCLAAGGDLEPGTILAAYRSGIFPGRIRRAGCSGGRPTREPSCRSTGSMNRGVSDVSDDAGSIGSPATRRAARSSPDARSGPRGRGSRPRCAGRTSACTASAGSTASRSGTVQRSSVGSTGRDRSALCRRVQVPSHAERVESGVGGARRLVGERAGSSCWTCSSRRIICGRSA